MPVVNREKERELVIKARERGWDDEKIKKAVIEYRKVLLSDSGTPERQVETPQPKSKEEKKGVIATLAEPATRTLATGIGAAKTVGFLSRAGLAKLRGDDKQAVALTRQAGREATKERDFGIFGKAKAIGAKPQGVTDFAREVIGTGVELGSFAAPGGLAVKGAKGILAKKGLKQLTKEAAALGAGAGAAASGGAALADTEQGLGQIAKKAASGALAGGAIGGAIPIFGSGAKKAFDIAGETFSEVLGKATGTSAETISEAFRNPKVGKLLRQSGKTPDVLEQEALDLALDGLSAIREKRASEYLPRLERIKKLGTQFDKIGKDLEEKLLKKFDDLNVKTEFVEEGDRVVERFNFDGSTVSKDAHQKALNSVMIQLRDLDKPNARELDALKRRLSQIEDGLPVKESGGARSVISSIRREVADFLSNNVDGYQEMTKDYAKTSELIKDIKRTLSLGENNAKATALKKIQTTLRQNNAMRVQMVEALEEVGGVGSGEITSRIAAAQLAPTVPRGLSGNLLLPAGLTVGVLSTKIPLLLLIAATTSPKLMGHLVSLLGKISGNANDPVPVFIRTQLRALFDQVKKEAARGGGKLSAA